MYIQSLEGGIKIMHKILKVLEKSIYKKRLGKTTILTVTLIITALLITSGTVTAIIFNNSVSKPGFNEMITQDNVEGKAILKDSNSKFVRHIDENTKGASLTNTANPNLEDVILEEDFEDAWEPDSDGDLAPPDWEVNIYNNGYNNPWGDPMFWYQEANDTYKFSGGYYAAVGQDDEYDGNVGQDEWLISPNITLPFDCKLQFWSSFAGYNWQVMDHDYIKIYSESGWTTIDDLSFNYDNTYEWIQFEYDLSAFTGQTINIGFHREIMDVLGNYVETHYWFVDDVMVIEIPYHDVGIISIDSPTDGAAESVVTPEVTVKNFGSEDEVNVPVNLIIVNESGYEEYNETEYVDLEVNKTSNVTFNDWTPNDWQEVGDTDILYYVTACTQLEDDENPCNNCQLDEATLNYPYFHDVGVISIDSPNQNGPPQTFPVKSTIKNMGQYGECCFKTHVEITEIGSFDPEYSDFVCIDPFEPGETQQLEFSDWTPAAFEQDVSGIRTYKVKSWTQMCDPMDENPINDALEITIELSFIHDVEVKEITPPNNIISLDRGDTWIYYDDGEVYAGIGLADGGTFEGAIRITPYEFAGYDGWNLTKIKFYYYEEGTHNGDVFIYAEGTSNSPGSLITNESFSVTGQDWYEINLSEQVTVNKNEDIWISIGITHKKGEYPLAVDDGPAVDGKGDWIYDGVDWEELQNIDPVLNLNWMIRAYLVGEESSDVYIGPGTHPVEAIILNNGTFTENNFKSYANITKETQTVYESNCTIDELDVGDETKTDFDDWSVSESGTYKLEVIVELENDDLPDNNKEAIWIYVDAKKPTSSHTLDPATPDGLNDWYISDVTVTLDAIDGTEEWQSGIKEIKYQINSGTVETIPGNHVSFKITTDSTLHTITYWTVDKVGNEEAPHHTFTFKMDETSPTINLIKEELGGVIIKKFLFTAEVYDETSGIDRVEFYVDDELQSTDDTEPYELEWQGTGNHTVYAIVYDLAGNNATSSKQYTPHNSPTTNDSTLTTDSETQNTQSKQIMQSKSIIR